MTSRIQYHVETRFDIDQPYLMITEKFTFLHTPTRLFVYMNIQVQVVNKYI